MLESHEHPSMLNYRIIYGKSCRALSERGIQQYKVRVPTVRSEYQTFCGEVVVKKKWEIKAKLRKVAQVETKSSVQRLHYQINNVHNKYKYLTLLIPS